MGAEDHFQKKVKAYKKGYPSKVGRSRAVSWMLLSREWETLFCLAWLSTVLVLAKTRHNFANSAVLCVQVETAGHSVMRLAPCEMVR